MNQIFYQLHYKRLKKLNKKRLVKPKLYYTRKTTNWDYHAFKENELQTLIIYSYVDTFINSDNKKLRDVVIGLMKTDDVNNHILAANMLYTLN